MLNVIAYFQKVLSQDERLNQLLSKYEGEPAITWLNAPNDMKMPYVVTSSVTSTAEDNYVTDRMYYNVDIYCTNGDIVTCDAIRAQIVDLLANRRLPPEIGVVVWKDFERPIPEKDPHTMRIHVQFGLRHI